jgi:hypothetical protein
MTYVRVEVGFPPRHVDRTRSTPSECGAPAVGMNHGSQTSGSFNLSDFACSRLIWGAAASSAALRASVSTGDASRSNLHFVL